MATGANSYSSGIVFSSGTLNFGSRKPLHIAAQGLGLTFSSSAGRVAQRYRTIRSCVTGTGCKQSFCLLQSHYLQ